MSLAICVLRNNKLPQWYPWLLKRYRLKSDQIIDCSKDLMPIIGRGNMIYRSTMVATLYINHNWSFKSRSISIPKIILFMRPTNERRRYIVTSSLMGWAHAQKDPCGLGYHCTSRYPSMVQGHLQIQCLLTTQNQTRLIFSFFGYQRFWTCFHWALFFKMATKFSWDV